MSAIGAPPPAYTKRAVSSPAALVLGGAVTFTHGLGATPRGAQLWLVCTTADLTYAVGDKIAVRVWYDAGYRGPVLCLDNGGATVKAIFGNSNMDIYKKDASGGGTITAANWSVVIEAWL